MMNIYSKGFRLNGFSLICVARPGYRLNMTSESPLRAMRLPSLFNSKMSRSKNRSSMNRRKGSSVGENSETIQIRPPVRRSVSYTIINSLTQSPSRCPTCTPLNFKSTGGTGVEAVISIASSTSSVGIGEESER